MADFFIRRPIVAIVASIVITLLGLAVLQRLSIEQYPELSPPTIRVETTYQGASAEVVEQSVATPIEQQVNGVDNMIYMKSLNTSDGRMLLDVSFQVGMNRDMANVLAQNRVSQAQSRLPLEVTQQGVTVKKINPSILMVISLYSPKGSRDAQFLNNYSMINVRDALLRVPGIAQVDLYGGAEYGMRVWLRPDRLTALGLTPADVISAIKEQNLQAPAGQVGAAPSPPGQEFTYTVKAPGRLVSAEEFENIILRQSAGGRELRLKDVARVELGSENYRSFGRAIVKDSTGKWLEGPAAALTVYLLPGANQLASAEGVYHTLEELATYFPTDMAYEIVYDTTPAVEASIEAILHTLVEAFILVSLVVFVFLQSFRATIIPLLTVPVSLIGTFIFFPLLGFSINTLTMFGLVLAIGIVVDDAIVVVEAVIHHIEHGKSPHDATVQAMKEVSGPVVAIALILSAVFVPVALLGGLTGRLYQQFALTIAISVLLSAFLALSLAPALCAMILKPAKPTGGPLGAFYRGFNKAFDVTTRGYVKWTKPFVRKAILCIGVVVLATLATGALGQGTPGRVRARRGHGHLHDQRAAPSCVVAGADGRSGAPGRKCPEADRGHRGVHRRRWLGHPHQLVQPRVRVVLLQAGAVGGAGYARAPRVGHPADAPALPGRHPGGSDLPLHSAHHSGFRRGGWLQLPAAGPQRDDERGRARQADPGLPGCRAAAARGGQPVHVLQSAGSPGPGRAGPREGA